MANSVRTPGALHETSVHFVCPGSREQCRLTTPGLREPAPERHFGQTRAGRLKDQRQLDVLHTPGPGPTTAFWNTRPVGRESG